MYDFIWLATYGFIDPEMFVGRCRAVDPGFDHRITLTVKTPDHG